ncbi:rhomboid family intramembrane serine protease [Corynebacterium testudinoris]|uniref:Putative membrane protein n=1 Tax=Corynebacterium testudinoris TaxID=136857 RepID=A0A0G3H264_9CORY|nr:rhomboid family intramembrane serine protease [Corynebacterium testudinoris]AKK07506.1 putative membrane protein [Corynebacterium testudinoris]
MEILRRWYRDVPATTALIAANVLVWLITAVQSRSLMGNLSNSQLADDWLLWGPYVSQDGASWFRAIGSMFLHVGMGHLAINCFMLALIGREIERAIGSSLYVVVYFAGGIFAAGAVVWMDYGTPTAGASGALFALMVLLVGVFRRRGADLVAPLVLIGVNVAYTFISSSVSLWGHLGGLIAGALMLPFLFSSHRGIRWGGVLGVLVAGCALIVMV